MSKTSIPEQNKGNKKSDGFISIENENHNSKKEGLGPNTKR